jgi:hypothetical protein
MLFYSFSCSVTNESNVKKCQIVGDVFFFRCEIKILAGVTPGKTCTLPIVPGSATEPCFLEQQNFAVGPHVHISSGHAKFFKLI